MIKVRKYRWNLEAVIIVVLSTAIKDTYIIRKSTKKVLAIWSYIDSNVWNL